MMDMNENLMMMKPVKKKVYYLLKQNISNNFCDKKIKCRNWPNCRLQDCHFYHPTETVFENYS